MYRHTYVRRNHKCFNKPYYKMLFVCKDITPFIQFLIGSLQHRNPTKCTLSSESLSPKRKSSINAATRGFVETVATTHEAPQER